MHTYTRCLVLYYYDSRLYRLRAIHAIRAQVQHTPIYYNFVLNSGGEHSQCALTATARFLLSTRDRHRPRAHKALRALRALALGPVRSPVTRGRRAHAVALALVAEDAQACAQWPSSARAQLPPPLPCSLPALHPAPRRGVVSENVMATLRAACAPKLEAQVTRHCPCAMSSPAWLVEHVAAQPVAVSTVRHRVT